jgi:hypothetical protein
VLPVDSVAPLMSTATEKQPFDALIRQARIKSSWPSGPGFRSTLKDGSGKSYAIPPFLVSVGPRPSSYPCRSMCRPMVIPLISFSRPYRQPTITLSTSLKVRSRVRTHTQSKTMAKACLTGYLRYMSTPRRLHTSTLSKRGLIKPKNGSRH